MVSGELEKTKSKWVVGCCPNDEFALFPVAGSAGSNSAIAFDDGNNNEEISIGGGGGYSSSSSSD